MIKDEAKLESWWEKIKKKKERTLIRIEKSWWYGLKGMEEKWNFVHKWNQCGLIMFASYPKEKKQIKHTFL